MKTYFFKICGVNFALSTEKVLLVEGDSLPFLQEEISPDVHIQAITKHILMPKGQLLGGGTQRCAYQEGMNVIRCLAEGKEPYALVEYGSDRKKVSLSIRDDAWYWASDKYHLWNSASLPHLLLAFRTLIFHASYIAYQGHGIIFAASSGTGKSTQAELWKKYRNAKILNGDKVGVSVNEPVQVHGVPFSGTSGICENVSLPLSAVVILAQAKTNSIRQLSPSEAAVELYPNVFIDRLVPDEWNHGLNLMLDLISKVPVYLLECTPDEQAVETLERVLNL